MSRYFKRNENEFQFLLNLHQITNLLTFTFRLIHNSPLHKKDIEDTGSFTRFIQTLRNLYIPRQKDHAYIFPRNTHLQNHAAFTKTPINPWRSFCSPPQTKTRLSIPSHRCPSLDTKIIFLTIRESENDLANKLEYHRLRSFCVTIHDNLPTRWSFGWIKRKPRFVISGKFLSSNIQPSL